MNDTLQQIVRAVGSQPLVRAAENCFARALLDSDEEHPTLLSLLHHLVSVDHELLEALARSQLKEHPQILTRLVVHAYNSCTNGKGRGEVRRIAQLAGLGGKLPIPASGGDVLLTESQERVLSQLQAQLEIFLEQAAAPAPIRMRIAPLIVAPTGVGKTFLTQLLARRNGIKLFRTSVAEWMVLGSKAEPTLGVLAKAIERSPHGLILHIDEIDKLSAQESWSIAQRGEIFAVADRNIMAEGWTDAHRAALRDKVFVVGSGTWQQVWTQLGKRMGFVKGRASDEDIEVAIRTSNMIPEELLNRWSPTMCLGPMTALDFTRIAEALNITKEYLDPETAVRGGKNFRAVESALTSRALAQRAARRQKSLLQTP